MSDVSHNRPATSVVLAAPEWNWRNFLRDPVLGGALIVLVTLVAYLPAMRGGFIWDDDVLITENPMIKASEGLQRVWFTTEAPDYYPVTASLWWAEWRWWGNSPAGYHVVNVLLHAANAVLVVLILRRLKIPGAWLAGLVFAIHPVNVATVAWISEQKNTLSMFFYTAAVLLYLRFDEDGHRQWYGCSLAAFLLALLSKSAVVMLPMVLLGCGWWLHGRTQRKDWVRIGPFFGLSMVLGIVTMWFQYYRALTLGGLPVRTDNVLARAATAGCALWFYLYKALWPFDLSMIYPKWRIDASQWTPYAPGILLLVCLGGFWWKRRVWGRPLLFAFGYFVVMLTPVLGFWQISFHEYSLVADHWQYHAIVGVIALVTAAGVGVCRRMGPRGWMVGVLASVVVVGALGMATWTRASIYGASESLWQDTVTKNPNSWVARYNLGNAYAEAGQTEAALREYQQAVDFKWDLAEAHYNMAFVLMQAGRVDEAITHLVQATRIHPGSADGHYTLGNALLQAGRLEEASEEYQQTVRLNPNFAEAHYKLGALFAKQGKIDEAIAQVESALKLEPNSERYQRTLEKLLQARGTNKKP